MIDRKPIFDAIRSQFGNLTQAHVDAINKGIDKGLSPVKRHEHTASQNAIDLKHEFEGFARVLPDGRVQAYPDPGTGGAPWTIGFGSTTDEQGNPLNRNTIWTRERAEKRFLLDLKAFESDLNTLLGSSHTTQNQFDAMVSLMYNIGTPNFSGSTLLRKHKVGDFKGAQKEFVRWNRANGRIMRGLTRRREAEAKLYGK